MRKQQFLLFFPSSSFTAFTASETPCRETRREKSSGFELLFERRFCEAWGGCLAAGSKYYSRGCVVLSLSLSPRNTLQCVDCANSATSIHLGRRPSRSKICSDGTRWNERRYSVLNGGQREGGGAGYFSNFPPRGEEIEGGETFCPRGEFEEHDSPSLFFVPVRICSAHLSLLKRGFVLPWLAIVTGYLSMTATHPDSSLSLPSRSSPSGFPPPRFFSSPAISLLSPRPLRSDRNFVNSASWLFPSPNPREIRVEFWNALIGVSNGFRGEVDSRERRRASGVEKRGKNARRRG